MKKRQKPQEVFSSLDDLKNQLFPNFVKRERSKRIAEDTESLGASLAEKAIEAALQSNGRTRGPRKKSRSSA